MIRLIPMKELPSIVAISRAKIYELIKIGQFPPATELTACRSAYRSDLIEQWILDRPFVTKKSGGQGDAKT